MTDEQLKVSRKSHLDAILNSTSPKKLIVAGPGTGKTHTFKELLRKNGGENLVMTFINNLVRELTEDLGDVADVNTFHGYCRHLLHAHPAAGIDTRFHYFPALPNLIEHDISVERGTVVKANELSAAFMNLDDSASLITDYLLLGNYYDAVSHNDAVYRVYKMLESSPELIKPYTQIVVDEYQDFSLLEASVLNVLASVSPILVAGDDDQALYGFKHASADYIRSLYSDDKFENFELPYCTRCTQVITDATAQIITAAQSAGKLNNRIDKPYICYIPDKRADSAKYPKITWADCTVQRSNAPYMAKYIEKKILEIPSEEIAESRAKGYPAVLIVGPSQFTKQIVDYLRDKFPHINYKSSPEPVLTLLDGYKILLTDAFSNLGWRVVAEVDAPSNWATVHEEAVKEKKPIHNILPSGYMETHIHAIGLLKKGITGEALTPDELVCLKDVIGMSFEKAMKYLEESGGDSPAEPDITLPTITATSLLGAKGLQAGHVFVVGLNEGHFPKHNDNPTDDEICQLLVALTRTKKRCYLVSCDRFGISMVEDSVFLEWLRPFLTHERVDRQYFNSPKVIKTNR